MSYLCNRNRETKIANDKVPWMSGLVSGLQNRVRRFESARNLNYRFKALESQALSRAYFLWVPIGVPILGHMVTLHDVSIGHENILITYL